MLAYYVRNDGEVVADSTDLAIIKQENKKVHVYCNGNTYERSFNINWYLGHFPAVYNLLLMLSDFDMVYPY